MNLAFRVYNAIRSLIFIANFSHVARVHRSELSTNVYTCIVNVLVIVEATCDCRFDSCNRTRRFITCQGDGDCACAAREVVGCMTGHGGMERYVTRKEAETNSALKRDLEL